MKTKTVGNLIPIFKLCDVHGKVIALVPADNIESVFEDDGDMYLITIDGQEFIFFRMEYVPV